MFIGIFRAHNRFKNKMLDYGRSNFSLLYLIITDLNIVLTSLLQFQVGFKFFHPGLF